MSDRRTVLSTLKGHQTELRRIGSLANEAIANQKTIDDAGSAVKEFKKAISEIKELGKETDDIIRQVKGDRLEELNNALTGKIGKVSAKTAGLHKRIFETINPRKLVRVPKGTSQADYYAIMQAISQGDKKAIAQYTVKKPPKSKKPKPRKDSINFDSFDSRDRVHLHDLLSLLNRQDATPCGKGWSGTKPPGCKRSGGSSKAAKTKPAKTVAAEIESNTKPAGKKARANRKANLPTTSEPPKQEERSPLPANHTVSSDKRITAQSIDQSLDGITTAGAKERIAAVRQIIEAQGIQAVFNDKASTDGKKNKALFDQIETPLISPERKEAIKKLAAAAKLLESRGDPRAAKYKDAAISKYKESIDHYVGIHAGANGYTSPNIRHIVVATDSKAGSKEFRPNPHILKNTVQKAIELEASGGETAWSMSDRARKMGSPDTGSTITYLHEFGHQVKWAAESTKQLGMSVSDAKSKYKSLTAYAKTSEDEWFAEHFTAWTLDADSYRKFDPGGADYIEKAVKLAQKAKRRIP